MSVFNINFTRFFTITILSHLFFISVVGADYSPNDVLIIGRPEAGGVNVEGVQHPFNRNDNNVFWYLDPNSEGSHSIARTFPCDIPADKPQQYKTVILEKGMLNEVALSAAQPAQPLQLLASTPESPNFTQEDAMLLEDLKVQREIVRQSWVNLIHEQRQLGSIIIEKLLLSGAIVKSLEHGKIYYRPVLGGKDTFASHRIVPHLIAKDKDVPCKAEFQEFNSKINDAGLKLDALDEKLSPLYKKKEEDELRANKSAAPLQSNAPQTNVQYEHIQNFINRAWNLVAPGGTMIVFAGDAQIPETALAQGVSREILAFENAEMVEEGFFASQKFEGEVYIANPLLPANINTMGWSGGRFAGSYFLIKKQPE